MTQAQLNLKKNLNNSMGFENITWSSYTNQIECNIRESFSLIIKKRKKKPVLILRKSSEKVYMDLNQFDLLCDLKESIHFLVAFIEGNSTDEHKNNVRNSAD